MDKTISSKGKLICSKNILYSIVALAAKEISGVVGVSKKTDKKFASLFQGKDYQGIIIDFSQSGELLVDIYLDVYSDISAPDLCFRVQENIKNNVQSMVNVTTSKVNVHIVDVVIKKEDIDEGTF